MDEKSVKACAFCGKDFFCFAEDMGRRQHCSTTCGSQAKISGYLAPCTKCGTTNRFPSGGCRTCLDVYRAKSNIDIPEPVVGETVDTSVRQCGKCGARNRTPSGQCRPCAAAYQRRLRKEHPEKVTKPKPGYAQAYYAKDPGRQLRASTKWRDANYDKVRANDLRGLCRRFGITPEQRAKMIADQKGLCAICGKANSNGHDLSIDHCHETKIVRQMLCGNCNRGLGLFMDDVELLRAAADYLNRHAPNLKLVTK